jgi:hypothetical protein
MKTRITLFLLFILFFSACDKTETPLGTLIPANTRLCLTMKHHTDIVGDTEVYLKLNSEEFPGYSGFAYDTLIMEAPNEGQICIEGLVYGNYWAMAKGFDSDWGDDVQGAIFFELNQFDGDLDTVLVVNEF